MVYALRIENISVKSDSKKDINILGQWLKPTKLSSAEKQVPDFRFKKIRNSYERTA